MIVLRRGRTPYLRDADLFSGGGDWKDWLTYIVQLDTGSVAVDKYAIPTGCAAFDMKWLSDIANELRG